MGVLIPQSRHAGCIHGPWFLTPSREDSRIYISSAFLCFVTQQASISLGALAQVQNHLVLPIHPRFPLLSGGSLPFSSSTPELGPPVTEPSLSPDLAPVTQSPLLWPSTPTQRNPSFYPPTLALIQCILLQVAASHLGQRECRHFPHTPLQSAKVKVRKGMNPWYQE